MTFQCLVQHGIPITLAHVLIHVTTAHAIRQGLGQVNVFLGRVHVIRFLLIRLHDGGKDLGDGHDGDGDGFIATMFDLSSQCSLAIHVVAEI